MAASQRARYSHVCISSDFWVASTISTAPDTGERLGISYARGEVSGERLASNYPGDASISSRTREHQNGAVGGFGVYDSGSSIP